MLIRIPKKLAQAAIKVITQHRYLLSIYWLLSSYEKQAAITSILGKEKFWSSTNFYHHLDVLQDLAPNVVYQQKAVNPCDSKTLSGCIQYTAVIADKGLAKKKIKSANLMEHVPQAIGEMYICAKNLKINTLHGALTDGNSWIFLIIVLNPGGNRANF
ncbi:hypothetical protein EDB83DRAFT_2312671 [Lactarius deliciosus]|nr:hypothetical protein EDB83DRAFT_2312671 [Lactarius deliciosus]